MLSEAEQAAYLGPSDIVASPDGKTLYVVNVGARQVAVADLTPVPWPDAPLVGVRPLGTCEDLVELGS